MLILQRKKNQALIIGNGIEVVVTEIKGDSVKIGINAPQDVPIYRKEIYEMIQKENKASANLAPQDIDKLTEALKGKMSSL